MAHIEDDEIMQDFVQESQEHLEGLESDLLRLEEEGDSEREEVIHRVFRAMHTIKGGAGFLGLQNIEKVAHSSEELLNRLRSGELTPSSEMITALLQAVDLLTQMVSDFSSSHSVDIQDCLLSLNSWSSSEKKGSSDISALCELRVVDGFILFIDQGKELFRISLKELEEKKGKGHYVYLIHWIPREDIQDSVEVWSSGITCTGDLLSCNCDLSQVTTLSNLPSSFFTLYSTLLEPGLITNLISADQSRIWCINDALENFSILSPPKKAPLPSQDSLPPPSPSLSEGSLRVPLRSLNSLMNLAEDLVLTRNQLVETLRSQDLEKVSKAALHLDSITSHLQIAVMNTRIQPIGKVLSRFARIVRDLGMKLNKQVSVHIEGQDVEVDKTIVESISDPLVHLVRNAVDHGIETVEERKAAGKEPTGHLWLRAFHQAGHVFIEVVDDGRGIDPNKIRESALEKKIIEPQKLAALPEKELFRLIFAPGFSTTKNVTAVSGRGVGLDVVYSKLTKLGGVVDVESKVGQGCTLRIKLPLTLAIRPSQMIRLGKETYAIPQVNLAELVTVCPGEKRVRIQQIAGSPVLRLREEILPLVDLAEVLGIQNRYFRSPQTGKFLPEKRDLLKDRRCECREGDFESSVKDRRRYRNSCIHIAIVTAETVRYGLVVDEFLDSEEIVVKALGQLIKSCRVYGGATIRGDGRVALILDILGISEQSKLDITPQELSSSNTEESDSGDSLGLILVRNTKSHQFAIPMSLVSRIDKVSKKDIEVLTGRMSIRYHQRSLPVISLDQIPQTASLPDTESLFLLVFKIGKQELGLLVGELVDVVTVDQDIDDHTFRQPGIIGSWVIEKQTILLLDIFELVKQRYEELAEKITTIQNLNALSDFTVLVVDDSRFYRNQISSHLHSLGCRVELAEDGVEALEKLESSPHFNLVLTDLKMPRLDGLGLIKSIRKRPQLAHIPLVAVTGIASKENARALQSAGADRYLVKLAKDQLTEIVSEYSGKRIQPPPSP